MLQRYKRSPTDHLRYITYCTGLTLVNISFNGALHGQFSSSEISRALEVGKFLYPFELFQNYAVKRNSL